MRALLMGFMGAGKSTLGERVAREMGYPFIDADTSIEKKWGMSVNELFSRRGESFFRSCEYQWLIELEKVERGVVALGGGTPCTPTNMALIRRMGVTVYLSVDLHHLKDRLMRSTTVRPLIEGVKRDAQAFDRFVREKLREREPFYKQADIEYDATTITESTPRELARLIQLHCTKRAASDRSFE